MADAIILRADARHQGLARYFTGKPCKRGHVAERYTRNLTCVECDREKQRAAQWHVKNRERHNELGRESYQRHKDKRNEYNHRWWEVNAIGSKYWFATPIEIRRQRRAIWREQNKDKVLVAARNRSIQKRGAGGTHTTADLAAIIKAQRHRCAYCRADLRKVTKNLDHIVPLASGGTNDRTNLQYTCAPCNLSKRAKDSIVFARFRGMLL